MLSNTNNWKVVHVDIPAHWDCPVETGYAVAWHRLVRVSFGCQEMRGTIVVGKYSGYLLLKHAVAQCNTLNLLSIDKENTVIGALYTINREYVYDAV